MSFGCEVKNRILSIPSILLSSFNKLPKSGLPGKSCPYESMFWPNKVISFTPLSVRY